MLKTIADRPERRTALQAGRRKVHGCHALLEPVCLVGLSEGVEIGNSRGEGASRPAGSLKLGFGAAKRGQGKVGRRRRCNGRDGRRRRAGEGATRVETGRIGLGRFFRGLGRNDGDKSALLLEKRLDWSSRSGEQRKKLKRDLHTTTATPSDAERLAIENDAVKGLDGTGGFDLAGVGNESAPFTKVDIGNGAQGSEAGDDVLQENALGDAADKDLGVFGIDRGPLSIECVDDDVVPLTLVL